MHKHTFKPPHISGDGMTAAQWVMLVNLWWAFRNARRAA